MLLFGRQHEPLVEELSVLLQYQRAITSKGGVLTLPAAAADLRGWITDRRKFLPVQHDDWTQVIDDFRASAAETGSKLATLVQPITAQIDSLLNRLISSTTNETTTYNINESVRDEIKRQLEHLDDKLATESAILAAWGDLKSCVENPKRSVEQTYFRRDTLYAVAQRRNLDVTGSFGLFRDLRSVITDSPLAVRREIAEAEGIDYEPIFPPEQGPTGVTTWQRLRLCEQILKREPYRGDCIVWLRLEPASLPQHEVTHGQVTFYNASYLSAFIGHPELAHRFNVRPTEVLTPPEYPPFATADEDEEDEWENNPNMVYARIVLPGIECHTAEAKARALVEGLKAVNHATTDTWNLLNGAILFMDGERRSVFSWGDKHDMPEMFYPQNDWMGRDVAGMARSNRSLDIRSLNDLQDAIAMSTTLKIAYGEGPEAAVLAAVRAIEHVNVWTTGGVKNWVEFARNHFKKAESRARVVESISEFTQAAVSTVPSRHAWAPKNRELTEIRCQLKQFIGHHEMYNTRRAVDHVPALRQIYADHWLARGLGELEENLTARGMYARIEEQGRRFDRHLARLKRLRNSAIHGGPVSGAACESVAPFASYLGHLCLNEAMRALLTGRDIPSHMKDFRDDDCRRYQRIKSGGSSDDLFIQSEIVADEDD